MAFSPGETSQALAEADILAPPARQPVVQARRGTLAAIGAEAWDACAGKCGASFRGSYAHVHAQATKAIGRGRMTAFEFWLDQDGSPARIGQCAVLAKKGRFEIQESLQLLPGFESAWRAALEALLTEVGAGLYDYGSAWSAEPSRLAEVTGIRGVTVDKAHAVSVQSVKFENWPSFDQYWAAVSENVRRNARKAEEGEPPLTIERREGLAMLRTIPDLVKLQHAALSAKGVVVDRVRQGGRLLFNMALNGSSVELYLARAGDTILSFFYGMQVGKKHFYIFGGQRAGASGANWLLMKEMLRRAYERAPDGEMVMGNVDYAIHEERTGGGLLRARRSLRVSETETAILTFRYAGA